MKYIVEIDENKKVFAKQVLNSLVFVKSLKEYSKNEITNKDILKSIEKYETKKSKISKIDLKQLKKLVNA